MEQPSFSDMSKLLQGLGRVEGQLEFLIKRNEFLEARVLDLERQMLHGPDVKSFSADLPEDDALGEYQEDPRAKKMASKLFGLNEDMEDSRE